MEKSTLAFILEVRRRMEKTKTGFVFRSTFYALPPEWMGKIAGVKTLEDLLNDFALKNCRLSPSVLKCSLLYLTESYALLTISGDDAGDDDWLRSWVREFGCIPIPFSDVGMDAVPPHTDWANTPRIEHFVAAQKAMFMSKKFESVEERKGRSGL